MSKQENTLSESIGLLCLTAVGVVYRGFAMMLCWTWLIAERIGVRRLTFWEAAILVWLAGMLTYRTNLKTDPEGPMRLSISVALNIVLPTLTIALAAIAKAAL